MCLAETVATGERRHTNECWLTFVHLDDEGRPAPVPPLALETPEDHRLHAAAASAAASNRWPNARGTFLTRFAS